MVFIYRLENQTEKSFFIENFNLMQTIGAGQAAFIERDIDMHDIIRNYEICKGQFKTSSTYYGYLEIFLFNDASDYQDKLVKIFSEHIDERFNLGLFSKNEYPNFCFVKP